MGKSKSPTRNYSVIAILLILMTFASSNSAMETPPLQVDQTTIQITASVDHDASEHIQNILCHEHSHYNNCHSGSHHCCLLQNEYTTHIFDHLELNSSYSFNLSFVYLDVPLHPPQ